MVFLSWLFHHRCGPFKRAPLHLKRPTRRPVRVITLHAALRRAQDINQDLVALASRGASMPSGRTRK